MFESIVSALRPTLQKRFKYYNSFKPLRANHVSCVNATGFAIAKREVSRKYENLRIKIASQIIYEEIIQ
jgi:hypothetical protein